MKKYMKEIFRLRKTRGMSLRYKIAFMTLWVAMIPIILFGIMLMIHYSNATEQRSKKHIEENIRFMSKQISQVFSDGVLCTNYLTLSINGIEDEVTMRQVDRDSEILSILNQTILMFDGIDSILYVDNDKQLFTTNVNYTNKKDEILLSTYMKSLYEINNGKTLLFDQTDDCMRTEEDKSLVTMGKKVVSINSGVTLGYLFINIDSRALEESIQNQISYYLLLDTQGTCIAGTENEDLLEALQENGGKDKLQTDNTVRLNGNKYLIAYNHLEESGWTVVGITNLNEYNVTVGEMVKAILLSGAVAVLLMLVLSGFLSKMLTKPLIKLEDGAEQIAKGNLDIRFHFKYQDEIGRLGDIFNYMTEEIDQLIRTAEEAGKKKREYELALVQEQVKPHFLYNTLDIIIILIDMNKTREAHWVTKKLADYYKNSLSSSEEVVPLEKEIQIVEDYLELQMMRYGDKFTYEIDVEDLEGVVLLPRMTLQPLVENALYHGLKYKEGWGKILICAVCEENEVILTVSDDGIGMKEELLTELSMEDKPHNHFGVYSVDHRLKLYYGDAYHMEIHSVYGEGTQISLYMPKSEE